MESDSSHVQIRHIIDALRFYVESLKEAGVLGLPCATNADTGGQFQMSSDRSNQPESPPQPIPQEPALPATHTQAIHTLDALRAEIGDCQRCSLCEKRTQIVFGVGDPHAELVFVGEGPGHEEDIKGEPFVGRAGQLLTEINTKGMRNELGVEVWRRCFQRHKNTQKSNAPEEKDSAAWLP